MVIFGGERLELLLSLAVLIVVLLAIAVPTIIICKIMDIYYKRKEKIFNEKHPKYIEFRKKFDELQNESMKIWNDTIPDCRREVEYCLEEIKYHPQYSEKYQYLEAKLDVTRRKIERCQDEYDKKENEIYLFVQANKDAIEELRDDDFNSYVSWVERYNLDKVK